MKDFKNNGNNNIKQVMIIVAYYLSAQANPITVRHIFTVLQKFEVNAASLHILGNRNYIYLSKNITSDNVPYFCGFQTANV